MSESFTCPTCNAQFSNAPENAAMRFRPFCSNRCKLVDLSHWLSEDYRVAGPSIGDGFAPEHDPETYDDA